MSKCIAVFLLALLIGSCAPVPVSPTPPPTASITPTFPPSPAPSATLTPVPQTSEHLIVTRDREHFALLNADGSLQKYIQIRDLAWPSDISSDGKWMPYQLGAYETKPPYDLSLNLLNLDDGTSQFLTTLISPDFPENIGPIIKSLSQYDRSLFDEHCTSLECRKSRVEDDVVGFAGISEWSPDGQFLAFAAQIDGPSTDLYIYNMQDKSIRRLTNDLQNIGRIEWSPDGKRILYANDVPGIIGSTGYTFERTFHVTDLEGKILDLSQGILAKGPEWDMRGWISDNLYLLQFYAPNPGQHHSHGLVVVNVESGQIKEIWPYRTSTEWAVIDPNNQTVVLSFRQPSPGDPIPNAPEPGTYFISANGESEKISNQVFSPILNSSQIIGTETGVAYHILRDGSVKRIDSTGSGWLDSSSPDKKWFFLDQEYDEPSGHNLLSLYSNTYQRTRTWLLDGELIETTWRPDSLGIFLFTSDNIYYLSIPDGEPQLLNVEVPPCQWDPVACAQPDFAWRP